MLKALGFILLFITLLGLPADAFAQQLPELPAVEVDLWPEYDDPGVLVIYKITLPGAISLPAEFKLRIPQQAGKPNAVAARQPDGSLLVLNYQQQNNGKWSELSITATSPELQVEYYDPSLVKEGTQRDYTFEWPGDYAVQAFTVQVQEPINASQMQISPDDLGLGQQGGDGLVYYNENIGAIPAAPFQIQLSYDKTDDKLSIDQMGGLQSPASPSTASTDSLTYLPWLIGIIGLGVIAGGIFWYLRTRQEETGGKNHTRSRRRSTSQKYSGVPTGEGFVYCHQCGRRATAGDHFCRACGSELRS